ncbi:tetratricopeptide repeat protein [Mucilaginibacter ginsenosidivorans]|uniref:Tetratricopeptide repeat protein n=1 Tax=Mucilaginibacter ginsenosidivorans TaxID=398053 RepID=A0A5B8UT47_9SPHI|nr:tetratricopeptide repeat protein [Mucilaginibacter ginsenosidivorans]QEC62174.1 tetratricopeptide repeat protein [Mucilaginibacter ginsenosidivorans]
MKRNTLLFYFLLIVLAVTAVYSNHFYNGFHFDDSHSIYDNPNIRHIQNIPKFFKDGTTSSILPQNQSYRPVTTTSLAIDYWLSKGYDPFFYHLSTFITFLLQGLLMVIFFNKLFGLSSSNKNITYVALFATAWYLLHPAIAETVNYIIARADVQSTVAVLAGFVLYACSPFCRRTFIYLLPVAVGILAKPPAVMFAPIFFFYTLLFEEKLSLIDIFRRVHLKQLGKAIIKSVPAFVVCAGMYLLVDRMTPKTWEPGGHSPLQYVITQPFVILHYFITFFWPTGLSADSDWGVLNSIKDWRFFAGCLFLLIMISIAFYTSRSSKLRPISFGILWFFIALAPTSSIIPLGEVLNDHRMFFPFVGLVLSVSWALSLLIFELMAKKDSFLAKNPKLLWLPVLAILATCAYGTWKRNNVWHSEKSLWQNVTIKSPKNGRGLMNFGNILVSEGKYAEAENYFGRALQLLPNYSFIYINMGVLKDKQQKFKDAESYFIQGILLGPQYAVHHKLYGKFLYDMRRYREAEVELERSLNLSAGDLETHKFLMETFDRLGEWDNLELLAKGTLQLEPGNTVALGYLEDANKKMNKADLQAEKVKLAPTPEKYLQLSLDYYLAARFDSCIAAAQEAIKLKPDYAAAYNNIGSAYIALEQFDKAIEPLKKALSLEPGFVLAKNNLALAQNHSTGLTYPVKPPTAEEYVNQSLTYYNFKLYDLCIVACECALEQKPDYDLAYNNMCAAYNALGQWDNAIKTGEKGLQINPKNQLLKNNLAQARAGKASSRK